MEIEIIKSIQSLNSNFLDIFCKIISYLASYIGFLFCFFVIFLFFNKKYALTFGITYGVSIGINYLLKYYINRPRPYVVDPLIVNKLSAVGQSFPSGHALSAGIIAIFLIYLFNHFVKTKWLKLLLNIICICFVILTIFARLYLGQHYISDTIAGVILACVYSIIALLKFNKGWKYGKKRNIRKD